MVRLVLAAASASAALAAGVATSYSSFREIQEDMKVEEKLPSTADAQKTRVVRIPRLLSHRAIDELHAFREAAAPRLGSAGRTSDNMAAAYRAGAWEVDYLNTDGVFRREAPELRRKLVDAVVRADAEHWRLLDGVEGAKPRCVEYHVVEPGGSLPYVHHHDGGSLLTIDVMLCDRADYDGGHFQTLEADGELATHEFEKGDALVFVSHKPHCVSRVLAGQRRVLVMEMWEGDERECGHRCERHYGPCGHSARASFWRRALSDLASDL